MNYLIALLLLLTPAVIQAKQIHVTDVAQRNVTINIPVKRVMLADSRVLLALNILHPTDPLKNIVAWDDAFIKKTPDLAKAYKAKNIPVDRIPIFPNPYLSDFSIENALQYQPDLIIFDIGLKDKLIQQGILEKLKEINLPAIFIDFRQYPIKNTLRSISLLGEVFSEQQNAEKFISFYNERLALIRERINKIPDNKKVSVFIERHAGLFPSAPCCVTFGKGGFGELITAAGGKNIGGQWFDNIGGEINAEQLIASQPQAYFMTASDWRNNQKKSQSVPLGYLADEKEVTQYYENLINRPIINTLGAVKNGHVLALYHQYYNSPFNILAIEVMAKFLYPDTFQDLDPAADNHYLHQTFTSINSQGIFWFPANPITHKINTHQ